MIYVYIEEKKHLNKIKYVVENIFCVFGLKYEWYDPKSSYTNHNNNNNDIFMIYSKDNSLKKNYKAYKNYKNVIFIKDSNKLFCSNYLNIKSLVDEITTYKLDDNSNVISIYNDEEALYINKFKENDVNVIVTNLDLISDIFFMLTRYEEVVNCKAYEKEKFNRFPVQECVAYKNNFVHRPIVNEDIELIWSWIDDWNLGYERKKWWGEKAFATCLTHDVDHIQKYGDIKSLFTSTGSLLLKHKNIKGVLKNLGIYFISQLNCTKDPFWTFDYMMQIENKYGFKSSFYFMSLDKSENKYNYSIDDNKLNSLIQHIENEGFEVGYHSGLDTYNDFNKMKNEKENLDKLILNKSYGCRQHYLKFKVPFTWAHQEKVNLLYDTTLGYSECAGFRAGTCFPYKPYDLIGDRVLDIWEIPLVVMEASLKNCNYTSYKALEETIKFIEIVKKYNGVFTFLWHNSSFDYNWSDWKLVYEEIMKYLGKSNCLGECGRNIINIINK